MHNFQKESASIYSLGSSQAGKKILLSHRMSIGLKRRRKVMAEISFFSSQKSKNRWQHKKIAQRICFHNMIAISANLSLNQIPKPREIKKYLDENDICTLTSNEV